MGRFHSIPLSAFLLAIAVLGVIAIVVVLVREQRRDAKDAARLSPWAKSEMDRRTVVRRLRDVQRRHGVRS